MKTKIATVILGVRAIVVVLVSVNWAGASVPSGPSNGSFETGDFTGWTANIDNGIYEIPQPGGPSSGPAGSVEVITGFTGSFETHLDSTVDGNYFAKVATGHCYFLYDPVLNPVYNISVSQTFTLNAGETLMGWAAFYNGDYVAQDTTWVSILDSVGAELSRPWQAVSGYLGTCPYLTATPWTEWAWTAPETGTYTLALGATTFGDDAFATLAFFDDIHVLAVPEPSANIILIGGLTIVLWHWRLQMAARPGQSASCAAWRSRNERERNARQVLQPPV